MTRWVVPEINIQSRKSKKNSDRNGIDAAEALVKNGGEETVALITCWVEVTDADRSGPHSSLSG